MLRKPIVNGSFYPNNPLKLKEIIGRMVSNADKKEIKGAVLPHAGYIYSGKTAVKTVEEILPKKRVVILGTNHTGKGKPFSVYPEGEWQTPLGNIEIDKDLSSEIVRGRILETDTQAHIFEHSIEVEIPILQFFFKDFKLTPIVCSNSELAVYKDVAKEIHSALQRKGVLEETCIFASSDMTHYEPQQQALKKDKEVIEEILKLNTYEFLERIKENHVSMCGTAPVAVLMEIMNLSGNIQARLADYTTSGETNKDYSSVVGYSGILFEEAGAPIQQKHQ